MGAHEQLNLFTEHIFSAHLVAQDSPRKAFYHIWVEKSFDGGVRIVKESGIMGRVLDRRAWPADNVAAAEAIFLKRIKSKTNPDRKSPRKYQLIKGS